MDLIPAGVAPNLFGGNQARHTGVCVNAASRPAAPTPVGSQATPRKQQRNGGSLQGGLRSWDKPELQTLCKYADLCRTANGRIDWVRVVSSWRKNDPETWLERSKECYSRRYRHLKSSGELIQYSKTVFDGHKIIERRNSAEETSVSIEEQVTLERGTTEKSLKRMLDAEFGKSLCTTDRLPVGRVRSKIHKEWLEWSENFIREKLSSCGSHNGILNVINASVYTVAKVIKRITSKVPKAIKARQADERELLRLKLVRLRKETSHMTQEIARRKSGANPTPRQKKIAIALRRHGLKTTAQLEHDIQTKKVTIKSLNNKVDVLVDEALRRMVRGKPLSKVASPRDNLTSEIDDPEIHNTYWTKIDGTDVPFTPQDWMVQWANSLPPPEPEVFNFETAWEIVLKKTKSWKAAGPDGIQGYWLKKLPIVKETLFGLFRDYLVSGKDGTSSWIGEARTVCIPKKGDLAEPGNHRPIACLNTILKLLDGLIAERLRLRFEQILPKQQMALRRKVRGCEHCHAIDQCILEDARSRDVEVHQAWIDYVKAFNSLPFGAIKWLLKAAGFDRNTVRVYLSLMRKWVVQYEVRTEHGTKRSAPMRVRCGVLQGDTLSPMIFCLATAPISHYLEKTFTGYEISAGGKFEREGLPNPRVSHLFYMDDLKLYAESPELLKRMIGVVKRISGDFNLQMNSAKCATVAFNANAQPSAVPNIPSLGMKDTYKYLGIEQAEEGNSSKVLTRVWETVCDRFTKVWESKLTFHEKVLASNSCVMPVLRYVFINCFTSVGSLANMLSKADNWDVELRNILTRCSSLYKHANRERLSLPADLGGYGLKTVKDTLEDSVVYSYCYLMLNEDLDVPYHVFQNAAVRTSNGRKRTVILDMRQLVARYNTVRVQIPNPGVERQSTIVVETVHGIDRLSLAHINATAAARCIVKAFDWQRQRDRLEIWTEMAVASRVIKHKGLNMGLSFGWVQVGHLNSRAVATAFAIQEGQVRPNSTNVDGSTACRRCNDPYESIAHIVSGCRKFRHSIMTDRHDDVCKQLHFALCKKLGLRSSHHRQVVPAQVGDCEDREIWWAPVFASAGVECYKPDIVVWDHGKKQIFVVEVTVCWYDGIQERERQKYAKYAINGNMANDAPLPYPTGPNLARYLSNTYFYAVDVIPVAIGTCGEVSTRLVGGLSQLGFSESDIKDLVPRLQRSAVLGTGRVLRAHMAVSNF